MRYSALDDIKEKSLHIGPFSGGTDLSADPLYINPNALSESKNVFFSQGMLKTRSGLSSDSNHIIKGEHTADSFFNSYKVNENDIFINNTTYRIITETSEIDMSEYRLSFYLLDRSREITAIGSMQFKRTSDEIFYIPSNVTLFKAKEQSGCGIYAFLTLSNMHRYAEKLYEIYELDSYMLNWERKENFYIPTVYINGRGDRYNISEGAGNIISEKPRLLEAPNMLNGIFCAYYSSDGYSSSFALPYSNLSDEALSCRIYYSLTAYTDWAVNMGETTATKEFMGVNVTMNVDRSKGIIFFTVEAGDYAVPYMSKYTTNNIRIIATKRDETAFSDIVSCTCCRICDSRIVISGGNKQNQLYTARYDNPLYFPQSNYAEIGDASLKVKALNLQNDKLLAFKHSGIYKISIKKGEIINTSSLLADNDAYFYKTDSFTVTRIESYLGCESARSITTLNGNTFFCGSDGNFYGISSTFDIKPLSEKIRKSLKEISKELLNQFVVVNDDKYCYFIFNNRAFVADVSANLSIEKINWYLWEFPSNISIEGGISCEDSPLLLCNNGYSTCYAAVLDGNKDVLLDATNLDSPISEVNIESRITTSHFALKNAKHKSKLNRVYLNLSISGNPTISLNGNMVDFTPSTLENLKDGLNRVLIFPEIRTADSAYITLESDEYLAFCEGDIYYV